MVSNEDIHLKSKEANFLMIRTGLLIPALPEPSETIINSLAECDASMDDIDLFKPSNRSKRRKAVKRRRLNGFIAFRSYYSRAAKSHSSQRKLSSLLAKVWKEEANKHVWSTYASVYNETGGNDDFILWLEKNLEQNEKDSTRSFTQKRKHHAFINDIEDVFLTSQANKNLAN